MGACPAMIPTLHYRTELRWTKERETSLAPGDDALIVMAANRRLFKRWMEAGHGEWMVPRDAFDVMDLADMVGSLCVYDRDEARDDYLCRVFGGSVAEDLGVDMTGRYLSSYPERLHRVVRDQYYLVMASRRPLVNTYRVVRVELADGFQREDRRFLHEKIILPVTRTGRAIECLITHVARMPTDAVAGNGA